MNKEIENKFEEICKEILINKGEKFTNDNITFNIDSSGELEILIAKNFIGDNEIINDKLEINLKGIELIGYKKEDLDFTLDNFLYFDVTGTIVDDNCKDNHFLLLNDEILTDLFKKNDKSNKYYKIITNIEKTFIEKKNLEEYQLLKNKVMLLFKDDIFNENSVNFKFLKDKLLEGCKERYGEITQFEIKKYEKDYNSQILIHYIGSDYEEGDDYEYVIFALTSGTNQPIDFNSSNFRDNDQNEIMICFDYANVDLIEFYKKQNLL